MWQAAARAANRVMGLLLQTPAYRLLGKNIGLFSYAGRKSGKRYSFPLGYFRAGETIAIFAGNPWWRNFREPAPVTLRASGHDLHGLAHVVTSKEESGGWLLAFLRALPNYAKFYGVELGPDGRPDPESTRRAAEKKVVVRIDLR